MVDEGEEGPAPERPYRRRLRRSGDLPSGGEQHRVAEPAESTLEHQVTVLDPIGGILGAAHDFQASALFVLDDGYFELRRGGVSLITHRK